MTNEFLLCCQWKSNLLPHVWIMSRINYSPHNLHCFFPPLIISVISLVCSQWYLYYSKHAQNFWNNICVSAVQGCIFVDLSNGEEKSCEAEYLPRTVIACLLPAEKHFGHSTGRQMISGLAGVKGEHRVTPWFTWWCPCWFCFPFTAQRSVQKTVSISHCLLCVFFYVTVYYFQSLYQFQNTVNY